MVKTLTKAKSLLPTNDSEAFYDQIEQEFEAIKQRYRAKLGAEDVAYIKGLRFKSRVFEVLGRGLLWTSRNPISFGCNRHY